MALLLLGGIPGQAKTAAAVKIASSLKESGVSVGQPANVEEELLELFPEYKGASTLLKGPLVSLIGERAQDEIRDKWPEAYARAVEKATAGKPDVAIVTLCFEYYRYETYEFYSPVNSKAVKDSNAKSTLTLIDDIFDIYFRLSQKGQLFDVQELIERTFPTSLDSHRTRSTNGF